MGGWNKTQSQEEVLNLLVKAQNEQPQLQWKLRSRTFYAYAGTLWQLLERMKKP